MEIKRKRFEELTTGELYEILRCRSEVFIMEQDCVYQDLDGIDQKSTHLYAEEDGKIVSYLRVIDAGVKYPAASIGRVITMKEGRGRGLATMLIGEALEIAREKWDVVEIEAQAYLREYYERFGFVEISDVYMYEGLPHISMKLEFQKQEGGL